MALRAVKPTTLEKRLKALFYGPAGVGKTTAAIQFPRPYLIDPERGAENDQYVKLLASRGGVYFGAEQGATDADEVIREVTSLLSEKHDFVTLIIDPLTVIYNDLIEKGIREIGGTEFGRHKAPADRKIKHLFNLLLRLDMNVVITSHAKGKWRRSVNAKGQEVVAEDGMTFDCYGKLEYLFDLVFEIDKRGAERVGIVRKTRVEAFPEGDVFPFSYAEIARRYGKKTLERGAEPEELASAGQVAQLENLCQQLSVPQETIDRWFAKAGADSFAELPADAAGKCIKSLLSKLTAETQEKKAS